MPDKLNLHQDMVDVRRGDRMLPYTGVRIIVEAGDSTKEDQEYFVGDETGTVLELNCPWGTQAIATDIYNSINGYCYVPIEVTGSVMNPAAEMGDGIQANGVYGGLYKENATFGHMFTSDFSAPKDEEIDHEYTFVSQTDRKFARQRAQTRAEFRVKADEISAKVSQEGGDNQSFGWSLVKEGFGLYSNNRRVFYCDKDGITVDGSITARSGYIGNGSSVFTIDGKAIYNGKPKFQDTTSTNANGVYIGTDGIALGRYTSTSNGTTTYDDAFRVSRTGQLVANNATIRGAIYASSGTFKGNLTVDSITFSSGVTIDGSNITDGTVSGGKIGDGAVTSGKIGGGAVTSAKIGSNAVGYGKCASGVQEQLDAGETALASFKSLTSGGATVTWLKATNAQFENMSTTGTFTYKNKQAKWQSVTINGSSYNLMAQS